MTLAAMAADPAERVRALIVADEESAKLAPDRWPDLSLKALRERETLDRTTLDKLHAVARKDLAREDRPSTICSSGVSIAGWNSSACACISRHSGMTNGTLGSRESWEQRICSHGLLEKTSSLFLPT